MNDDNGYDGGGGGSGGGGGEHTMEIQSPR
jgi:hypothetical protein